MDLPLLAEIWAQIARHLAASGDDDIACGRIALLTSRQLCAQMEVYLGDQAWLFSRTTRQWRFVAQAAESLLLRPPITFGTWQQSVLEQLIKWKTPRTEVNVRRYRRCGWSTLVDHLVRIIKVRYPGQHTVICVARERMCRGRKHSVHVKMLERTCTTDMIVFADYIPWRELALCAVGIVIRDTSHSNLYIQGIAGPPTQGSLDPLAAGSTLLTDQPDDIGF